MLQIYYGALHTHAAKQQIALTWTSAVDDVGSGWELEVASRLGRGDSSRSIKLDARFFRLGKKLSRKLLATSAARVAAGTYWVGEEAFERTAVECATIEGSAVDGVPNEDGGAGKES